MRLLLTLFTLGAGAYVLSRRKQSGPAGAPAAFSPDQPRSGPSPVRDAGPGAMRDGQEETWSAVDEASDQSFPASDPPASY